MIMSIGFMKVFQYILSFVLNASCRFLASGNSYRDIGFYFYTGESTIALTVKEVCRAIWKDMQPIYMPEPCKEFWLQTLREFEHRWDFPHALLAIDGKHIWVRKPLKSGTEYFCYK